MTDKLKPCPFCDGEAKILTFGLERYRTIGCSKCGVQLPVYETIEQAIEAWNNRPNPWHTGEPTNEGWYLCKTRVSDFSVHHYDGNEWDFCPLDFVIKWRKIKED